MTGFDPAEFRRLTEASTSAMHGSATQQARLLDLGRYVATHYDAITTGDGGDDCANAWDEGFIAAAEWTPVGPSGVPHDPPQNPFRTRTGDAEAARPQPQCRHRHPTRGIQCELDPHHAGQCAIGAPPQSRWYPS